MSWQHKAGGSLMWEAFGAEQQKLLTDALESGEATVEFILGKNTFVVDLKAMTQTNKADKQRVRKVRYYVQGNEKKFINAPEKWLASDGFAKCGEHEQNVYKFLIEAAVANTTFQGTGPLEQRMPEAIVWAGGVRARMFHNSGWPVTISLTILGCSEHGDIHVNCGHYLFERAEFTNGVVRPRAGYVTLAFGPDGKRSVFVVDPAAKAFEHESYGDFNWGESVHCTLEAVQ